MALPSGVLNNGPLLVVSSCIGADLGWWSASKGHVRASNFVHGWPLVFLIVAAVFVGIWVWRERVNDRDKEIKEQRADEDSKKLDAIYSHVTGSTNQIERLPRTVIGKANISFPDLSMIAHGTLRPIGPVPPLEPRHNEDQDDDPTP